VRVMRDRLGIIGDARPVAPNLPAPSDAAAAAMM